MISIQRTQRNFDRKQTMASHGRTGEDPSWRAGYRRTLMGCICSTDNFPDHSSVPSFHSRARCGRKCWTCRAKQTQFPRSAKRAPQPDCAEQSQSQEGRMNANCCSAKRLEEKSQIRRGVKQSQSAGAAGPEATILLCRATPIRRRRGAQNKPNLAPAGLALTTAQDKNCDDKRGILPARKQSQFPRPRLRRRFAPGNDLSGREAEMTGKFFTDKGLWGRIQVIGGSVRSRVELNHAGCRATA